MHAWYEHLHLASSHLTNGSTTHAFLCMHMQLNTTNQDTYKPFAFPPGTGTAPEQPSRTATTPPPEMPNIYDTTYRRQYLPKEGPARQPAGKTPSVSYTFSTPTTAGAATNTSVRSRTESAQGMH